MTLIFAKCYNTMCLNCFFFFFSLIVCVPFLICNKLISHFAAMSAVECAFPFHSPFHSTVKPDDDMANKLDNRQNRLQVSIGPCKWIFNEKCQNADIKFYLYTRKNQQDRQLIQIEDTWEKSNLSESHFNPNEPTKIIVHGYNSDMFLTPLIQMKGGLLLFHIILVSIFFLAVGRMR